MISIHALLAESDFHGPVNIQRPATFLSTLSLRRATPHSQRSRKQRHPFLSTLSLRRATQYDNQRSDGLTFLSTLSLRRATGIIDIINNVINNFYPRSPCGERPNLRQNRRQKKHISIHALLAESDLTLPIRRLGNVLFLSTLSLRRATQCKL